MGASRTQDMIQWAGFDAALADNLQNNHYPPVPLAWIPACKQAIEAFEQDDTRRLIESPFEGRVPVRAYDIVRALHLEPFIKFMEVQ